MLKLHHIRPAPLRGFFNASEVWDKPVSLEKGKNYLITAPSGKGKSTFLHLIYGLRKDFEGSLSINNFGSNDLQPEQWAELRSKAISIVFQDLRLFDDLTALENIQVKNQLTGHKTENEIKEFAEALGITALMGKVVSSLSYGQRQRVAIIRALCQPFDFLLLDEPFSHLDEANTEKAKNLIMAEVEKQGAAMILTSLGSDFDLGFDRYIKL